MWANSRLDVRLTRRMPSRIASASDGTPPSFSRRYPCRMRALRIPLAVIAIGLAGWLAYQAGSALRPPPERVATVLQNPQEVGDLTLIHASSDEPVRLATTFAAHDWTLVFFGFVNCPDVCPITMSALAETYRDLGEPDAMNVVMITVDPENDDAARVDAYATGFHPDFEGYTGSAEQISAAASRFFVGYGGQDAQIVHTEAVALVDAQGRLRGVYGQDKLRGIRSDLTSLLAGDPL